MELRERFSFSDTSDLASTRSAVNIDRNDSKTRNTDRNESKTRNTDRNLHTPGQEINMYYYNVLTTYFFLAAVKSTTRVNTKNTQNRFLGFNSGYFYLLCQHVAHKERPTVHVK